MENLFKLRRVPPDAKIPTSREEITQLLRNEKRDYDIHTYL